MLEEHEWGQIALLLRDALAEIKNYRVTRQVSLAEAKAQEHGKSALEQ